MFIVSKCYSSVRLTDWLFQLTNEQQKLSKTNSLLTALTDAGSVKLFGQCLIVDVSPRWSMRVGINCFNPRSRLLRWIFFVVSGVSWCWESVVLWVAVVCNNCFTKDAWFVITAQLHYMMLVTTALWNLMQTFQINRLFIV